MLICTTKNKARPTLGGTGSDTVRHPKICGDSLGPVALANPLAHTTVGFKTSSFISDRGFNMSYSVSPCGGVLSGPQQIISSPNFPQNYPDNTHCVWMLKFSPGSQIEVIFNNVIFSLNVLNQYSKWQLKTSSFALESACEGDNVTIRNGQYPDSPVLWSGCGMTLPPDIITQSNIALIEFVADKQNNNAGFNITAVEHTTGCGGLLHGQVGTKQC